MYSLETTKKPMSILCIAILILSTLGLMMAAIPAHAGTQGTLTVSSSKIYGNMVIQVTVTDPDLTGPNASMPSVTVSKSLKLYNGTTGYWTIDQGTTLPMYQTTGGSWVGFITVGTPATSIPASPPAQDPNSPLTGWDTSAPFTSEPQISVVGAHNITAQVQNAYTGSTFTITYNDVDPPASISVTIEVSPVAGVVATSKTSYPPGAKIYATIEDNDMNLDPTEKDTIKLQGYNVAATLGANNYTYYGNSTALATEFGNATETGANTGVFQVTGQLGSSETPGSVIVFKYNDAAPAGTRTGSTVISTHTGTLTLDKDTYYRGDVATITLVEPDLNLDEKAKESFYDSSPDVRNSGYVYVYSTTNTTGSSVKMTETGLDTGVFTGQFMFSTTTLTNASKPTIKVTPGDTITVLYWDAADELGSGRNATVTAKFASYTGTLELDRDTYSAGWTAHVTLTDPDLNTDPTVPDKIYDSTWNGTKKQGYVYVYSTQNTTGSPIQMIETGASTGVFEGTFSFSNTTTVGPSPIIAVTSGSTVTVLYKDQYDEAGHPRDIKATATYKTTTGTVSLDKAGYSPEVVSGNTAVVYVTVEDPDRNLNPEAVDEFESTTYPGVTIKITYSGGTRLSEQAISMRETGPDTGVFTGEYTLPSNATRGDTITVTYYDKEDVAGVSRTVVAYASVVTSTGILSIDKTSYPYGGYVTITLTEPDLNLDPEKVDDIPTTTGTPGTSGTAGYVDIRTTSDPDGIYVKLTETGPNTGTFQGKVKLTSSSSTAAQQIQAKRGDTITVRYVDAHDASGAQVEVVKTATVSATTGTITLDKDVYSIHGQVKITVTDPDMNVKSTAADTISKSKIEIKTSSMATSTHPDNDLVETGPDTGVFEGKFVLNTQVGGVNVTAQHGDGLTVTYIDECDAAGRTNVRVYASATIKQYTGTVEFDRDTYNLTDTATITVTDPDANTNPSLIDSVSVKVSSDTDPGGLTLTAAETGPNTGVFTGTLTFSETMTMGTTLRVTLGDTITAKYTDENADPADIPGWVSGQLTRKDITLSLIHI